LQVFRARTSGAATRPPQGALQKPRSQTGEIQSAQLSPQGEEATSESRVPDSQFVQFKEPALEIEDPVQCMLEMSGILDFGTPKVVV
jgi:hypothetical protein